MSCYINGGKMEYDVEPFESLDVLKIKYNSNNKIVEVSTVFSLSLDEYYKNNKCLLTVPLLTDEKPFIYNDNIYHEIDFRVFQHLNDKITYCYEVETFDWILRKMQSLVNNGCILCYCIKLIEL